MSDNAKRREREIPAWVYEGLRRADEDAEEHIRSLNVPFEEMRWTRSISFHPGWQPDPEQWALAYVQSYTIPKWARRSFWVYWPVERVQRAWAWIKIGWQEQRDYWGWVFRSMRHR